MRTFQVLVTFAVLPLSYCSVSFLGLTPFIFFHQSITSNPPIPLIISFELSPSLWVLRYPRCSVVVWVWSRHHPMGLRRGERAKEAWMNLQLVLISISKMVLLFYFLLFCLSLLLPRLFLFDEKHWEIGFFSQHMSQHRQKLVGILGPQARSCLSEVATQMSIPLAHSDCENSDKCSLFFLLPYQPMEPGRIHMVDWSPMVWPTSKCCWLLDRGVFWDGLVNVPIQSQAQTEVNPRALAELSSTDMVKGLQHCCNWEEGKLRVLLSPLILKTPGALSLYIRLGNIKSIIPAKDRASHNYHLHWSMRTLPLIRTENCACAVYSSSSLSGMLRILLNPLLFPIEGIL